MAESSRPRRAAERRRGLQVAMVFGVPVYAEASVLLLAVLVTFVYGGVVRRQLELPPFAGHLVGLAFVVCLLASVLLHELGHALTARRHGIGVRGIKLELLGGYTEMDRDAPTPRVDLLVSLAGPAVSLVLGLAAVMATVALPDRTLPNQLAFQLALSNLVVAVFNILPGLPLDGGRVLRAAVWAVTRDRHRGTEVAGWFGRAVAVGTAVLAALLTGLGVRSWWGLAFMLLVALTLWQGAGQAIRVARISRRFTLIDLERLARPVFGVPTGVPLAEALRRAAQTGPAGAALGVADSSGRLVALVDRAEADAVPADRRPWVSLDAVAHGIDGVPAIPLGLTGEQVIQAVRTNPGAQYVVRAGEDVVGVLHVADLAQLLEPKRKFNQ
jgi:Zn-dependent protease